MSAGGISLRDLAETEGADLQSMWGGNPVVLVVPPGGAPPRRLRFPEEHEPAAAVLLGPDALRSCVQRDARVIPVSLTRRNQDPRITVGRSAFNDVRVESEQVSKVHCFLVAPEQGSVWTVDDNASTNGTAVGGEAVTQGAPAPVRPGDELRLGTARLLFLSPAQLEDLVAHCRREWDRLSGPQLLRPDADTCKVDGRAIEKLRQESKDAGPAGDDAEA